MTIKCQQKNNSSTTVGGRIKSVRKSTGLSQAVFAEKLDLTQGFIGHIENGRNQPTVDLLMRIAIIFKCDGHWLLTGEGQAPEKPIDRETQIINQMLADMTDEQKADVRKYAEEKKQLADCLKELACRKIA